MTVQNMAWKEAIVHKSKSSLEEVDAFLSKYQIFASPLMGVPHRLRLLRIRFSGIRTGNTQPGSFEFDWSDLACGVWAITSGKNLRGKTTVIEIVKWLLRGKRPNALQEDVYSWIQSASLSFLLDGNSFSITVMSNAPPTGRLERIDEGMPKTIALFDSEETFELAMEEFFLTALGIARISNWKESKDELEAGKTVLHGWPALSSVMFISTNYESLFGDMPVRAGINARLMQMFLGIPWVSTVFSAKTAQKQILSIESAQANEASVTSRQRDERIAVLTNDLKTRESDFAKMPDDASIRKTISEKSAEYSHRKRAERAFSVENNASQRELGALESALKEDKIALRKHLDSIAAGAIFRAIEPTCCPCCDSALKSPMPHTGPSSKCSLCGSINVEDSDNEAIKNRLELSISKTQEAIAEKRKHISKIQDYLTTNDQACEKIQSEIENAEQLLGKFETRNQLETEIQIIKGKIEELNNLPITPEVSRKEKQIAKAVVDVSDALAKEYQDNILSSVSTKIVEYAQRFGIGQIEEASLRGNASLELKKGGGIATSFSKLTDGEKLRIKVATVLAMLSVAEEEGVGRHPGLLMVDSPRAQEMADSDFEALIEGIESIATDLPFLQIFIAGRSSDLLATRIPSSNRKEAVGDTYLW